MKILALELSSGEGSIAWLDGDSEPFVRSFANARKHSGLFFETLQLCAQRFGAADLIVVGLGPGSYAGVRIAIAAAVGLRAASAAKLIGIPSICAIEAGTNAYRAIGDARRHSFYFAQMSDGRIIEGPALYSAEELQEKLLKTAAPVYTTEPLPQFPQAIRAFPSGRRLAELGRAQVGEIDDTQSLEPIYLREPHITVPKAPRRATNIP